MRSYAAHVPFSGEIDDVLDQLMSDGGSVVRRIAEVDAVAPFTVPTRVVLRELASLAVPHSKSTVPAAVLGDVAALCTLMRHVVLRPRTPSLGGSNAMSDDELPRELCANARWYEDPLATPSRGSTRRLPAHSALADDAIDAVRLVRAADALRQRGTTLKTAAGYEIFIDPDTGAAVFALRTADNDRLLLLRVDSPLSAGEANLRGAFVTPDGNLRIAFHRGRFSSPEAVAAARRDRPGRRRHRRGCTRSLRRPAIIARSPRAGPGSGRHATRDRAPGRRALVRRRGRRRGRARDQARGARGRGRRSRGRGADRAGTVLPRHRSAPGSEEAADILSALAACGMKRAAIDITTAFEDVRRVGVDRGEVLVEAGSSPSFVYVALGPGLRVEPLGGYEAADVPAWLPIGIPGSFAKPSATARSSPLHRSKC